MPAPFCQKKWPSEWRLLTFFLLEQSMKTYLAITLFAVMLSACDSPKDEEQTQKNQQTRQSEKSANVQGDSSEERYQEALAAYDAADLEKA